MAGEDVIQALQEFFGEGEFECTHGAMLLVEGSLTDDGSGDGCLLEEPGQGDMGWWFSLVSRMGSQVP